MQKASQLFVYPVPKKYATTKLWSLCERVAAITKTEPKRWLRYGESVLERSLIRLQESVNVKSNAALLTWIIKNIDK